MTPGKPPRNPRPSGGRLGRPIIGDPEAVRQVIRDLLRFGVRGMTVPELVSELMEKVPCSRRTAYRAIQRATEAGIITPE